MIKQDPDNILVWHVSSQEDSHKSYTVDLKHWHCECTDFNARRIPLLKEGYSQKVAMCKHIRKALDQFGWTMLEVMRIMDEKHDHGLK